MKVRSHLQGGHVGGRDNLRKTKTQLNLARVEAAPVLGNSTSSENFLPIPLVEGKTA